LWPGTLRDRLVPTIAPAVVAVAEVVGSIPRRSQSYKERKGGPAPESMVGGTTFHREMIKREIPEPWSSTSLAKQTVLKTPRGEVCP